MKEEIISNMENPEQLEVLYRENKSLFRKEFLELYPVIQHQSSAAFWNARLNYASKELSWGSRNELFIAFILALVAGIIAKIPDLAGLNPQQFYIRNVAFIAFPALSAYFFYKEKTPFRNIIIAGLLFLFSAIYINTIPGDDKSDTFILACIHLPLLLWAASGFVFTGNRFQQPGSRIGYLSFNGELVVMGAVTAIAGMLLSAITIGLFELINIRIEDFYFRNIGVFGAAAIPVISAFIIKNNPQLVKNVSPVIARIFTPLVLIMLTAYLAAIIYTGKDPYNDRDFLIIFNLLLIGVMAIILFSVSGTSSMKSNLLSSTMLFLLSVLTIIINGIALSAIIFRISEWGFTPNRIAVLGSNLLILINLMMVTFHLFQSLKNPAGVKKAENAIAVYLPVYAAWTAIIVFVLPVLWSFS